MKVGGKVSEGLMCFYILLLTALVLIKASQRVQSFGDFSRITAASPCVAMVMWCSSVSVILVSWYPGILVFGPTSFLKCEYARR